MKPVSATDVHSLPPHQGPVPSRLTMQDSHSCADGTIRSDLEARVRHWMAREPKISKLAYPSVRFWDRLLQPPQLELLPSALPTHLYLHIPFCERKCAFCGYLTVQGSSPASREGYATSLLHELHLATDALAPSAIASISIGGGTPGLLGGTGLAHLVRECTRHLSVSAESDIQVELSPDTHVQWDDLAALRDVGVNRLSLGIQSWSDAVKRASRRPPTDTSQENHRVLSSAAALGFRINIDLLYGLPEQTPALWYDSLLQSLEYPVDQLSLYPLSIRPPHQLARSAFSSLTREEYKALYERGRSVLRDHGLTQVTRHYFSRSGVSSDYERGFAAVETVIGLGLGAVSTLGHWRLRNAATTEEYQTSLSRSCLSYAAGLQLPLDSRCREFVIRTLEYLSVPRRPFLDMFNIDPLDAFPAEFAALEALGLGHWQPHGFRLTEEGAFNITACKKAFYEAQYL